MISFGKILTSPLKSQITNIERNYDRGIASYFSFLKWLILANFVAFLIFLLPFIIAPHIVILNRNSGKNNSFSYCLDKDKDKYLLNGEFKIDAIDFLVANVS